ncbi:ubiquitin carboxyl-terminal hydrolase CYLD-like [Tropilaelaps mercedesae]|uniref:ubiquitinyl hydrolase 1 n=1 Tax=Tropilaelaps mercedesae TaxID=418985 RepID=A0A1V9XM33_9ACAR|nr:ubiquitin carboxyl-terminal hydrolase CYLD-like [Tropilaelaps mercedesae]
MDPRSHGRECSPGAESFYSARESDTASLASFYLDAYDDLTVDEYQSAPEIDREMTPVGTEPERTSSAESTPRHSPSRQLRQEELPNLINKRHSHDFGFLYHREAGKPLVLQRSTSYMSEGAFPTNAVKKADSYSSVDYLHDSYDFSTQSTRRAPPNRARQWRLSMERLAQKERQKSEQPEPRNEMRMALECPLKIPLPKPKDVEQMKHMLAQIKSQDAAPSSQISFDAVRKRAPSKTDDGHDRTYEPNLTNVQSNGEICGDEAVPMVPLRSTEVKANDHLELQPAIDAPTSVPQKLSMSPPSSVRVSPKPVFPTPALACITPPRSPSLPPSRPSSPPATSPQSPLMNFRRPLSALPQTGRNSFASPPDDVPRRPVRSRRGTRSAGASRHQSITREGLRDSTRDLQEQIQTLLRSLHKKLNKSGSLGRSPTRGSIGKCDSGELSTSRSNNSLSGKPTRYSSIKRESTMEKLENILSSSSETKKVGMFDAESIEELSTYGRIGNYVSANNTDTAIFEEFDKHFDLMLEADSGEEDDFVKIEDENGHASSQSYFSSMLSGAQERYRGRDLNRNLRDESDWRERKSDRKVDRSSPPLSLKKASRTSPPKKTAVAEPTEPPPVPLKRRVSRDERGKLANGLAPEQRPLSGGSEHQQLIIDQQNEQLKRLQKNQEELEEKMRLLQEQLKRQQQAQRMEQVPPAIPVKRRSSKVSESPEHYNQLGAAVLPPSDGGFPLISPYHFDPTSCGQMADGFLPTSLCRSGVQSPTTSKNSFLPQSNDASWQDRLLVASLIDVEDEVTETAIDCSPASANVARQTGDHRSPMERADTTGNLQIPYDDFVFEVGSLVGVMLPPETAGSGRSGSGSAGGMAFGVVRWAGYINDEPMLGLEMDDYGFQSGYLHDALYFDCEQGKGLFARPEQCVPDERIQQMALLDQAPHHDAHDNQLLNMVYDPLPGDFPPLFNVGTKDLSHLVGRCKGIQGHHNSCYLDATLFAMFTTTSVFDFIIDRPREDGDIPEYDQVQRVTL